MSYFTAHFSCVILEIHFIIIIVSFTLILISCHYWKIIVSIIVLIA